MEQMGTRGWLSVNGIKEVWIEGSYLSDSRCCDHSTDSSTNHDNHRLPAHTHPPDSSVPVRGGGELTRHSNNNDSTLNTWVNRTNISDMDDRGTSAHDNALR